MRFAQCLFVGLVIVLGTAGCPVPEHRPPTPLPVPDQDPENPPFGSTTVTRRSR